MNKGLPISSNDSEMLQEMKRVRIDPDRATCYSCVFFDPDEDKRPGVVQGCCLIHSVSPCSRRNDWEWCGEHVPIKGVKINNDR